MRFAMKLGWACLALLAAAAGNAQGALYTNGFETDTFDWSAPATRVASGTNGIPSASGSFHAQTSGAPFSRWGGYNYGAGVATAFQEYVTSVDIYLDIGGGWNNDTRFDFTSAINNAAGTHLRDFAFNAGFYSGADRFVISASNNTGRANSFPMNSGRDPISIATSGWYTFEHHFYDNAGVLAVDMTITDALNNVLNTWTLSSPLDLISGVGGNRYGWFPQNEFSVLAFDNAELSTIGTAAVPEPASLALWGLGMLGVAAGAARRRKQTAR
jgi:hypothetical protein